MARSRRSPALTADELLLSLPDSIRIGPYDISIVLWTVEQAEENNSDEGQFSATDEEIRLAPLRSKVRIAEVMLHEITHALFWSGNIEPEDGEERIVLRLGIGWAQVYRDNPWLLDWLRLCVAE
jgi:hypothetical protein